MDTFWKQTAGQIAQFFATDPAVGLSADEACRRLAAHGRNELLAKPGVTPWQILLGQFKEFIIWVLVAAAAVSGCLGEWVDALAIVGIVILNAVLGFIQEYRAEQSLAALKKLASPTSHVLRNGALAVVPSAELVPGDVIELESGDHVPADGRLISHTANFGVQEASLTGESAPVAKHNRPLDGAAVPLAERFNLVFMGTSVVSGRARAVVTVTGMRTELGRIADLIQEVESEPTPLQRKLDTFGRLLVKLCFALVTVVFLLEWWRGGTLVETFLTAVSLAVAAIPEGLPAVVTVALALGVHRMVRRHALIRKLPSVETLGCATVICSDKTGTLTRNEMTVQAVYAGGKRYGVTGIGYEPRGDFTYNGTTVPSGAADDLAACLRCGVLCNGAQLIAEGGASRIVGDPTEGALLTCAGKRGLWKRELEATHSFVEELPFDSDRKMMSVIRKTPDNAWRVYTKGAPDLLLAKCKDTLIEGRREPLTVELVQAIERVNADMAGAAMRVLAVAFRDVEAVPPICGT